MKITANFTGEFKNGQVVLCAINSSDELLVERLFVDKAMREKKSGSIIALECTIDAPFQKRTFKQMRTVWKLVTVIFESMEGRKPCESEKQNMYLDLLDAYADRVPSLLNQSKTRPVHISEANTQAAAHFIDALLNHLAMECGLQTDLQAEVRGILFEWERWRGVQDNDYMDGRDINTWHPLYSEASGVAGGIDKHHILSRGAYPKFINCAWNILALTRDEHEFFHAQGIDAFLLRYPHLSGRVKRAFRKAGKSYGM